MSDLKKLLNNKNKFKLILNNLIIFLRYIKYASKFKKVGTKLKIRGKIKIYGNNLYVGNNVSINQGVILHASRGKISIGSYCTISPGCQIHTAGLEVKKDYKTRKHVVKSVQLSEGVWLCAGVIVNPGSKIGKGSIVAPGSVVTGSIPDFELWGGVPAKKIKNIK